MIKACLIEAGIEESNLGDIEKIYPLLCKEIGGQVMRAKMASSMTMYAVGCIISSPITLEALLLELQMQKSGIKPHQNYKHL